MNGACCLRSSKLASHVLRIPFQVSVCARVCVCVSVTSEVWSTYCDLYGPAAASCCKHVPPKCISGRWGAISRCEAYVAACCEGNGADGTKQFQEVLTKALSKHAGRAAAPLAARAIDDLHLEEAQEYSAKMGRWAAAALTGIKDCKSH